MALVCTTSNSAQRTTGTLLNYNGLYTACFWVLFTTIPSTPFTAVWQIDDGNLELDSVRTSSAVMGIRVTANGVATDAAGSTTLSTGTWYHLAVVRNSTTDCRLYLNGVQEASNAASTAARVNAVARHLYGVLVQGSMAWLKTWNTNLSAAQILQEVNIGRPANLASLFEWLPNWPGSGERTLDYSGNGRNYAEVGTPTDGDPPPVSFGAPYVSMGTVAPANPTTLADLNRRAPYYVPARIY